MLKPIYGLGYHHEIGSRLHCALYGDAVPRTLSRTYPSTLSALSQSSTRWQCWLTIQSLCARLQILISQLEKAAEVWGFWKHVYSKVFGYHIYYIYIYFFTRLRFMWRCKIVKAGNNYSTVHQANKRRGKKKKSNLSVRLNRGYVRL